MNSKEEKGFSAVTLSEFRDHYTGKWDDVRPVVIYFAGERFVVEYNEHMNPILAPVVAMVHAYLGNINLTQNDH
jgi:hypothetical protein